MRVLVLAFILFALPAFAADPAPLAVLGRIPGPDGDWDHATFDAETHRVYVARGNGLLAFDVETQKITPTLVPGSKMHVAVPLPGGEVLITDGGSDTAILADGRDGRIKARIPAGKSPDVAVRDPATGLVLVVDPGSSDVTLIDVKTQTVRGRIKVGGLLDGAAVDGAGKLYLVVRDAAKVAVVDIHAGKVLARFDLPGCEQPTGVAFATGPRALLVACSNSEAIVLSADDGHSLAELPIGAGADAVRFDARRGLGYVAAGGSGTLTTIRLDQPTDIAVVQTLNTAEGARTMALDAQTGRLYLPAGALLPPRHPGGVMRPKPGTFGLLIVGQPTAK